MEIKDRQKFLLVLAAIGVGLFVLDSVVIEPLWHSWTERSARIKSLKDSLKSGQDLIKIGAGIRDTWARMSTNTLKSDPSLAQSDMLKAFDRWAKDSGITVASIHPQWKSTGEDYAQLEVRADASGNISSLSKFLFNVEKAHAVHGSESEHIGVRIESVEVSARDNDGRQLSRVLQISGLQLGVTPDQ